MNLFIAGILKIVLLETCLGLLLASHFFERTPRHRRVFDRLFGLLALLSVLAFFNFGTFRHGSFIHTHEIYHFFFGSKYLSELRYDGLYVATIAASDEGLARRVRPPKIRDPMTFEEHSLTWARAKGPEVKARFSEARWTEFKRDLDVFVRDLHFNANGPMNDHGNTGSPSWAAAARAFTETVPFNRATAHVLAHLDMVLLALLFFLVWRTFGFRTMAITVCVGMLAPRVYDWLGGSILRMDWICALGASICLWARGRPKTGGLLLGYAVTSKLFVGLLVLPVGLGFVWRALRGRRGDPNHAHNAWYVAMAVVGLIVSIALGAMVFGGIDIWIDYVKRILVTLHEKYYSSQHSFRDVFLQLQFGVWPNLFDWTPNAVAAADPDVFIDDYATSFLVARILLVSLIAWIGFRHPSRFAFALGPLCVFAVVVTNMYYWQMWMIAALALAPTYRTSRRHMLYLGLVIVFLGMTYLFEHYGKLRRLQGYFGSHRLLWTIFIVAAAEAVHALRGRRFPWPARNRLGDLPAQVDLE